MKRAQIVVAAFVLAPLSCKRDENVSAKSSEATASAAPEPGTPTPASATATSGPASAKATVAGTSIMAVGVEEIRAALEKNGYVYDAGRQIAMGSTETIVVKAKRDGLLAAVTIIRPTGKSDHDRFALASPEAQRATFEKKGAAHYEAGVLVGVEVEGNPAEAKKLLEAILDG